MMTPTKTQTYYLNDCTEVILHDYEKGQGKIIISNPYNMNFSYYWGGMGKDSDIKDFLLSINDSYFVGCLKSPYDNGQFDGKASVRNIRQHIRKECTYDLPWYRYMEEQKELREYLREAEHCEDDREFVDYIQSIPNKFCFIGRKDREIEEIINTVCSEPWYYIEKGPSQSQLFLKKIFKQIQKKLKKNE